jgi:hypothetical protein
MSEGFQDRPATPKPTYTVTRRTKNKEGEVSEQIMSDPLGHRQNQGIYKSWVDRFDTDYPGILGNKSIQFGHLLEKERSRFYLNADAYTQLMGMAKKAPSLLPIAEQWLVGRVLAPAEISMGVGGAAITSENTKTEKHITREEKPSRFGLRGK